jgi:hypothetical protein
MSYDEGTESGGPENDGPERGDQEGPEMSDHRARSEVDFFNSIDSEAKSKVNLAISRNEQVHGIT